MHHIDGDVAAIPSSSIAPSSANNRTTAANENVIENGDRNNLKGAEVEEDQEDIDDEEQTKEVVHIEMFENNRK